MGQFNSSTTRAKPIFNALLLQDPTGRKWLLTLLNLPKGGHTLDLTDLEMSLVDHAWENEPAEKPLSPPLSLLKWLASNLHEPGNTQIWKCMSEAVRKKRKQLIAGNLTTIQDAIEALSSNPNPRAWYVLEGKSYPDVYLETRSLIVVIEGKRTEGRTTRVTSWMDGRHQMWRHIDCAWERRGAKQVYGFLIVESPEEAMAFARETVLDEAIRKSLPHRSAAEVAEITCCFLGATTWKTVCESTGIPWDSIAGITA